MTHCVMEITGLKSKNMKATSTYYFTIERFRMKRIVSGK